MGMTTIMMCLLFGTNFFLFLVFKAIKLANTSEEKVSVKDKMSKPFTGTLDCFTNLTGELSMTGLILALTYVCENHWIFEHSEKYYSRDLFIFVLILFFAYAIYTIRPNHDQAMLGREQTEEWKGWMQFIFLLYHYFHAEEVYNSVRVMITCYVWMTGFGNFSFFYTKRDFGWLRMFQMLWRLNFSCILLMWTHGNTYILYYICPMHTFYFLMVYATMYVWSSINTTKWGIRFKLLALGVLIYIIWDVNSQIFDFLFAWLGTDSIIGAKSGSVWEYYFRTSLDHWSTFFGMIFALNFPLAEQWFVKARGPPLYFASFVMGAATIWWLYYYYPLEKMQYNLNHSYFAIIPLTSYIFFRNITPTVRSGVSQSLHDLGKTTLETYLLQHHIWLTSNAKTLLTIVPGHPWINFALATALFFVVSKELYRITMTLRGMVMPDDKNIAWNNTIGMGVLLTLLYAGAYVLAMFSPSLLEIGVVCFALALTVLIGINFYNTSMFEHAGCRLWMNRAILGFTIAMLGGITLQALFGTTKSVEIAPTPSPVYIGNTPDCLSALSQGHWIETDCDEEPSEENRAYCQTAKWVWEPTNCPISKLSTSQLRAIYTGKRILFAGDSEVRNVYHQFVAMIDPNYKINAAAIAKHADIHYLADYDSGLSVDFVWAPMVKNLTSTMHKVFSPSVRHYSFVASGAALWDALSVRSVDSYSKDLELLGKELTSSNKNHTTKMVWLQPPTVVTDKLPTDEKRTYMSEKIIKQYRSAFSASPTRSSFDTVIDTTQATVTKKFKPVDGVHYTDDVYHVVAHMVSSGFIAHVPHLLEKPPAKKPYAPKPTGSMSFPGLGGFALALAVIMLFTMDSFLGIGWLALLLFGRSYDWEAAYGNLHRKILGTDERAKETISKDPEAGFKESDAFLDPKTQL